MNALAPHPLSGDLTQSIGDVLRSHARACPERVALVSSVKTAPLLFRDLIRQIDEIGCWLRDAGFGRDARIGIAFPNSPEAVLAILGILCNATVVPVNPNLTIAELNEQLASLRLNALLVPDGIASEAPKLAVRHGVPVIHAAGNRDGTIGITLHSASAKHAKLPIAADRPGPESIALILQTSGTTAAPKLAPRTHANLLAAAAKTQASFALSPGDLCLCATPLYHAQAVEVNVLPALLSGGGVAVPSNYLDVDVFEWLCELAPTWFAAGPTLLRRILENLTRGSSMVTAHKLRLVASGGASLPPSLQQALEDALGVPVLEYYGSSEAGHIASNGLPPRPRVPGTCGTFAPGELCVADESGRPLGPGELGEVLVRGPTVMAGYLDNPAANEAAFVDGWFRTGDLGTISAGGALTINGRVKEVINRGGAKISPVEVDWALLSHPAVAEAAAFARPHPRLGEDVAAAVVLRHGMQVSQAELRTFLRGRLSLSKVPRKIVILNELPKGPTGKVQRRRLVELSARELGEKAPLRGEEVSPLEEEIAQIWRRLLQCDSVAVSDDFFEKGGDSLLATEMLLELEQLTGKALPEAVLFEASTIRQLAWCLADLAWAEPSPLIEVQKGDGHRPPFFFFHGDYDNGGYYTRRLARLLGPEQAFIIVAPHKLVEAASAPSIEQMAADRVSLLVAAQPPGQPFRLGGYCNGGLVAFEVARLLIARGHRVELVAMVDSPAFNAHRALRAFHWSLTRLLRMGPVGRRHAGRVLAMKIGWKLSRMLSADQWARACAESVEGVRRRFLRSTPAGDELAARRVRSSYKVNSLIHGVVATYIPRHLAVPVIHFSADFDGEAFRRFIPDFEVIKLTATHMGCVTAEVGLLADHLRRRLLELDKRNECIHARPQGQT